MEFRDLLAALRASWWLPAVGLVLGTGLALVLAYAHAPIYTARTQFFVSTTDSASTTEALQGSQFSQQRVASYAQLLSGQDVAERVIDRLNIDESPASLSSRVTAEVVPDTVLIDVAVADTSAVRARHIAEAIGAEFPSLVNDLETPLPSGEARVKVTVTERAATPSGPTSPRPGRDAALGLVVGLLVGAALAIVRVQLDRTVKSAEEATALAGAPVIGVILRDEALQTRHTIDRNSASRVAEAYRQLRTNLQFLNVDDPPKVIMVSSAVPSEGKTTVAVNLALTLAEVGRSVVLVEGDLRRPRVTRYLGMVSGAGLTNILAGTAEVDEVLQPHGEGGLKVLAAGPTPPNPSELLASANMFSLINDLRAKNDFVLIDAPPLLPVADASGLAVIVDGVVLSTRYGKTRKEELQQARATLDRVGGRTLGIVLNIVPPQAELTTAYGYGYNYDYDTGREGR